MFSVPTLTQQLVSAQQQVDKPDVLNDYMRLCTRFLQRAPDLLLIASIDVVAGATATAAGCSQGRRVNFLFGGA